MKINDELQIENDELDFNSKFPTHAINILLNPNDGGSRLSVQLLDGELDNMNTLNGPGVIFAQVFPQMLSSGEALGIKLKAVVLNHDTGLKIQALLNQGVKS